MAAILEVSNILKISKSALSPHAVATKFSHPNPKFIENERLGFSNFGVPRNINLFNEIGGYYVFPRGLIKELFNLNACLKIVDHTITNPIQFNPSKIILKPFQQPVVREMLRRNQGIYVSPPGSGKTVVGIEMIIKRGQKSLVLVHTQELVKQWLERFRQFTTDITPGIIADCQWDVQNVTIATVQSLNRPLQDGFINDFGLVLLDEGHHCPAFTFQKLVNRFPAKFRYALTATPNRRDGLTFILKGVMGNIIYEVSSSDLFNNGEIMEPLVKAVHTNCYMPDVQSYGAMVTAITEDEDRNNYILELVSKEARNGHYCLVLSERIDHVVCLWEQFCLEHRDTPSAGITSRSSKKMRDAALRDISRGSIQVLFSTKLADEGLDIPRLDRLFLTCPIRSVNKVNQQIGRILRNFPGKADAVVYDFRDSLVSLAESQYHTRLKQVYHDFDVLEVPYVAS